MIIVLGDAVQDYYPAYKMPKMIDFGLGYDDNRYPSKRSKLNRDETWKITHRGTPGWNPPVSFPHACLPRWSQEEPMLSLT